MEIILGNYLDMLCFYTCWFVKDSDHCWDSSSRVAHTIAALLYLHRGCEYRNSVVV